MQRPASVKLEQRLAVVAAMRLEHASVYVDLADRTASRVTLHSD